MDFVIVPRYVPSDTKTSVRFVSSLYTKARTFRDARIHRDCNRLASEGARLNARLRTWWHATDYFSNAPNIQSLSRFSIIYQEGLLMAKNVTPAKDFKRTEWKGFLERPMTDAELASADEWEVSDVQLIEGILALTNNGYKLTLSYSGKAKTATATLMAGDDHGRLAGYALSAKGADGREAIKLLMYKHYHLLEELWLPLLEVRPPIRRG